MADKQKNSNQSGDKKFIRKANNIKPTSVKGGASTKYSAFVDNMADGALKRKASADIGMGFGDAGGSTRVPIMYVDPMFDPILLMFPKENLKELNRRLRHYYSFHPIVRNLINLHSTFPFGDMEVRCEDKRLEPYWQDSAERLDLMQMIVQMSRDYELLGECHTPSTEILMADGTTKPIKKVRLGDEVITESGLPCRVKYRTGKEVNERIVGISLKDKQVSWMTEDHPVMVYKVKGKIKKGAKIVGTFKFVKAGTLKEGDLLVQPNEIFYTQKDGNPIDKIPNADYSIEGVSKGKNLVAIKKIKHKKYKGRVYSMEIAGDPTFIADGIIVHNSFHVGNWDDHTLEWERFHQYPPENVEVHKIYAGSGVAYFLKPDEELRKMLNSPKEIDRAVVEMLPEDFKLNIAHGKPVHLDNSRVIHYANKSAGYLTRGESPLKAGLKYLLAEDKLYMLMLVFIDRHMFPIKIWKIGSKEQKWLPSKKHFDMLKQKLIEAKGDPDYDLVYHAFLDMEYKTGSTQHEDLIKWFDWTQKRILIAMFANEAMFAEASPYAKDAMSIKLIMHRYMLQRAMINKLITSKVWLPIAKKRGYIIHNKSEEDNDIGNDKIYLPDIKKYAVPKLFWHPSNLVSGMQEQEFILKMREKGDMPIEAIYDLLGYDSEKTKAALEKEQSTVFDPVWREARKEMVKDPSVRNQIIRGKKVKDIELPEGVQGELPPKSPGRPTKTEDDKFKPEKAIIPPQVQGPRDKQQEKGDLPAPKGEDTPSLPEM